MNTDTAFGRAVITVVILSFGWALGKFYSIWVAAGIIAFAFTLALLSPLSDGGEA